GSGRGVQRGDDARSAAARVWRSRDAPRRGGSAKGARGGAQYPAIHARRPASVPANGLSHHYARIGLRELMRMLDFFRWFLPLDNPLGFGAGDYLELLLAA